MKSPLLCFFVLGTHFLGSAVQGGKDKSDQDKLQGTWVVSKDGKTFAEMKFKGNNFVFTIGAEKANGAYKGTFKVDPTKKPKTIDMTVKEAPPENKDWIGKTSLGVYQIEGDTFKWNAHQPGNAKRPTTFPADPEKSESLYLVFQRAK